MVCPCATTASGRTSGCSVSNAAQAWACTTPRCRAARRVSIAGSGLPPASCPNVSRSDVGSDTARCPIKAGGQSQPAAVDARQRHVQPVEAGAGHTADQVAGRNSVHAAKPTAWTTLCEIARATVGPEAPVRGHSRGCSRPQRGGDPWPWVARSNIRLQSVVCLSRSLRRTTNSPNSTPRRGPKPLCGVIPTTASGRKDSSPQPRVGVAQPTYLCRPPPEAGKWSGFDP